jgi:2,4-diketo-3-deoxy-L-fuconate hydrolase
MRLVSFRTRQRPGDPASAGVLIREAGVIPLAGLARHSPVAASLAGADLRDCGRLLATGGLGALDALTRATHDAAFQRENHRALIPLDDCLFDAPLRPGKLITVARNYADHVAETRGRGKGPVPSASIKATSSLCGPYDPIIRPACERQLDYETELAVVIGKRCKHVEADSAYDAIAGYVVMNDVVAREVLTIERSAGNQLLGKMFDHFGPIGPALVTRDEIADPMKLHIETRVNGELRQSGNTRDMLWSIAELIEYFSQTTLEPGDIISTGTPAGVAAGRQAGESPWFLQAGDVVESTVENIGTLRSRVIDDDVPPSSWRWV